MCGCVDGFEKSSKKWHVFLGWYLAEVGAVMSVIIANQNEYAHFSAITLFNRFLQEKEKEELEKTEIL